jgi:hypothetical protein
MILKFKMVAVSNKRKTDHPYLQIQSDDLGIQNLRFEDRKYHLKN